MSNIIYRHNNTNISDSFPIVLIAKIFENIHNDKIHFKLDHRSAYYLVLIKNELL